MKNIEFSISDFVEKLLLEKGISGLPQDVLNQLKSDLIARSESLINAEILAHIPKDKLSEFEGVIDKGNTSEIQDFCQKNIDNLDGVVAGALIKLKNIYLSGVTA